MNFLLYQVCLLNGETSTIWQKPQIAFSSIPCLTDTNILRPLLWGLSLMRPYLSHRYEHTEVHTDMNTLRHFYTLRHHFANKGPSSQSYGFSRSHVWMSELNDKESWALKNWCFWTMVLEKALDSSLDCKEIQPVHPKGDESWIFIGRTDTEAETPILWPPDEKNWLTEKDPDAKKDWTQDKGMTEDEMVGWHHWLDGHEFEQAPGIGEGQKSLVCWSPWGHKGSDKTELNWTELRPRGLTDLFKDTWVTGDRARVRKGALPITQKTVTYWDKLENSTLGIWRKDGNFEPESSGKVSF